MLKNEEEKYKQKRENPRKRKGNLQSGDFFVFFFWRGGKKYYV